MLSSDAVFKFQSSTTQLQTLYESGYLPHSVTSAFDVHAKSLPLLASHVANWPQLLATFAHCPALAYEQHGDLNPRNMMLNVNGRTEPQVQLIDFARFGVWPAFYDISRLRLQLSLRLLDPPDMLLDTFAERMILWDAAWNGAVRPSMHHTQVSLNGIESFLLLQSELMRVRNELTAKLPETQRPHIGGEAHFNLLLLYDLIKMVSYVDASTFKRMWYLLLAAKIAQESFPS